MCARRYNIEKLWNFQGLFEVYPIPSMVLVYLPIQKQSYFEGKCWYMRISGWGDFQIIPILEKVFHEISHPAIRVPPRLWKPTFQGKIRAHILDNYGKHMDKSARLKPSTSYNVGPPIYKLVYKPCENCSYLRIINHTSSYLKGPTL